MKSLHFVISCAIIFVYLLIEYIQFANSPRFITTRGFLFAKIPFLLYTQRVTKILVVFDGSNFYNKVKKILPQIHLTPFNYAGLAQFITGQKAAQIIYYVGEIKKYPDNKKSEKLYANQQSLFSNIRKQSIEIKLGYLLLSDGKFHEKGVDVQIAVDITRGAIKNEYDICYLISSDTDLLPAIKTAKDEKKKIVYVGFENFVSRALSRNCSSYRILKKSEVLRFAKK